MPRDPHPSDWNRLFDPAWRRRGPLGMFFFSSFVGSLLLLFLVGGSFGARAVDQRSAVLQATQTPAWATAFAMGTATSVSRTALSVQRTATAGTQVVAVANAGNFRSAPRLEPATVIGQLAAGDQVRLVENRTEAGHVWYRVQLATTSGGLTAGAEGWVSATLLALDPPAVPGAAPVTNTAIPAP